MAIRKKLKKIILFANLPHLPMPYQSTQLTHHVYSWNLSKKAWKVFQNRLKSLDIWDSPLHWCKSPLNGFCNAFHCKSTRQVTKQLQLIRVASVFTKSRKTNSSESLLILLFSMCQDGSHTSGDKKPLQKRQISIYRFHTESRMLYIVFTHGIHRK